MYLDRVTITGADDSINPEQLLPLFRDYPFLEVGILVSHKHFGTPRFPSLLWIEHMQQTAERDGLALSLHLCGEWVRQLLAGENRVPGWLLTSFQRIQLNFHATKMGMHPDNFPKAVQALGPEREIIFQLDGVKGLNYFEHYCIDHGNGVPLFDTSGGAGVAPSQWPSPFFMADDTSYGYHGYAGGLGPHNLATELPRIAEAAGDCRVWIDLETHARSDNDRTFDLTKVRQCLELAHPFITLA